MLREDVAQAEWVRSVVVYTGKLSGNLSVWNRQKSTVEVGFAPIFNELS